MRLKDGELETLLPNPYYLMAGVYVSAFMTRHADARRRLGNRVFARIMDLNPELEAQANREVMRSGVNAKDIRQHVDRCDVMTKAMLSIHAIVDTFAANDCFMDTVNTSLSATVDPSIAMPSPKSKTGGVYGRNSAWGDNLVKQEYAEAVNTYLKLDSAATTDAKSVLTAAFAAEVVFDTEVKRKVQNPQRPSLATIMAKKATEIGAPPLDIVRKPTNTSTNTKGTTTMNIGKIDAGISTFSSKLAICHAAWSISNDPGMPMAQAIQLVTGIRNDRCRTTPIDADGLPVNVFLDAEIDDGTDEAALRDALIEAALKALDNAPSQPAPAQPMAAYTQVKFDPGMKAGLDLMIEKATNGTVKTTDDLENMISKLIGEVEESNKRIEIARQEAKQAQAIPATGSVAIDAATLTYKVVERKAHEVLDHKGAGKKVLDFDLPCLVWTDDQGNEVAHPDVPEADEHYQFAPANTLKALWAIKRGHNVWAAGHYGTGKSTFVEQLAARMSVPLYRLNLDGYIERSEIIGAKDLVTDDKGNTVTIFTPGVLPRVMGGPCWVLFDEMDAGTPDALFAIQRGLEKKGLYLMEDGGRLIKPHPLFRFFATGNSRGHGDEYGIYPNVKVMSGATMDRFDLLLTFDYMEPAKEAGLLKSHFPAMDDSRIDQLVSFAGMVRGAFENGELSFTASPRGLMSYCQSFLDFNSTLPADKAHSYAIEAAFLDKSPTDTRGKMVELAERAFG